MPPLSPHLFSLGMLHYIMLTTPVAFLLPFCSSFVCSSQHTSELQSQIASLQASVDSLTNQLKEARAQVASDAEVLKTQQQEAEKTQARQLIVVHFSIATRHDWCIEAN